MAKYLIVNADDFGMCRSANEAVFDLFRNGNLLSSTIMMPCPAAEDAVRFSVENPQYAIGVHTTLTSEWQNYRWKPLTMGPSLIDRDGFMWHSSRLVEKHATDLDIENEIRAQIDLALSMGMNPSHIDNHMGSLYGNQTGRFALLKLAYRICGEYGYAYRMFTKADKRVLPAGVPLFALKAAARLSEKWADRFNVTALDYLLFPDWPDLERKGVDSFESYQETILGIWTNIPDGVTETFVHPSVESDELKSITSRWMNRVWEYRLMKDPATHKYLRDHGVIMINYRDLIRLKNDVK